MPRKTASFWIGFSLISATILATLTEFLYQRKSLSSSSNGLVASIPIFIKTGTAALGIYLVFCGWPRRVGRGVHCRSCGYRREDDGRLVAQCPECASPWRWIGEFESGRRIGQRWMIILGLALLFFVSGAWVIRHTVPSLLLSWLPSDILLQQLASLPDEELADQWTEFEQRIIPNAKLDALADALQRKKRRDGYISKASEQVIYGAMNRLTQPTLASRQFYSQVLSAVAKAPDSAIRGEAFYFSADATFRGATLVAQPPPRVEVMAAAYIDNGAKPVQTWVWHTKAESDVQERSFTRSFTPDLPGPHAVRMVFWLAIGGNTGEVEFGEDGPIMPSGMRIFNQFEVAATVTVKDAPVRPSPAPR